MICFCLKTRKSQFVKGLVGLSAKDVLDVKEQLSCKSQRDWNVFGLAYLCETSRHLVADWKLYLEVSQEGEVGKVLHQERSIIVVSVLITSA